MQQEISNQHQNQISVYSETTALSELVADWLGDLYETQRKNSDVKFGPGMVRIWLLSLGRVGATPDEFLEACSEWLTKEWFPTPHDFEAIILRNRGSAKWEQDRAVNLAAIKREDATRQREYEERNLRLYDTRHPTMEQRMARLGADPVKVLRDDPSSILGRMERDDLIDPEQQAKVQQQIEEARRRLASEGDSR